MKKNFYGYENISKQLKNGVNRIRVGILIKDKIVARKDVEVFCIEEKKIGYVTSGGYSPSINSSIAMGYIEFKYSSIGSIILLKVRGKLYEGKIVPLPFIKNKYVRTNNSFRSFWYERYILY